VTSSLTDQVISLHINRGFLSDKFPEGFEYLRGVDLLLLSLELVAVINGQKGHFDDFFHEEILFD
jgi:hypothetical protein